MTRNPNLVATPVTDKNGKATTVHRKVTQAPSSRSALPAPRASDTPAWFTKLNESLGRLADAGFIASRDKSSLPANLYDNLERLAQSDTTGVMNDVVDHILNASTNEKECWSWAFLSQRICDADPRTRHADVAYRKAYGSRMAVQPVVAEIASRHKQFSMESVSETIIWKTEELTAGVTNMDSLKGVAIYIGLRCLEGEPSEVDHFAFNMQERADMDYIARNVDAIEPFIGEIASRHTVDREVIEQLLSSHPGLSSGNL
jgi:hypothetical protein